MSCENSAQELNVFINSNQYDKVVLVAHSMGGLVSSGYLALGNTQQNKVVRYVSFGTPYLGSVSSPVVCLTGVIEAMTGNLEVDENGNVLSTLIENSFPLAETLIHSLINEIVIKCLASNFASVYELFPTEEFFEQREPYLILNGIVQPTHYSTTVAISNRMNGYNSNLMDGATLFHQSLYQNDQHITTTVNSTYVYSVGHSTVAGFTYVDGILTAAGSIFVGTDGDSLVLKESAMLGDTSRSYEITTGNTSHSSMINTSAWKIIFGYREGV